MSACENARLEPRSSPQVQLALGDVRRQRGGLIAAAARGDVDKGGPLIAQAAAWLEALLRAARQMCNAPLASILGAEREEHFFTSLHARLEV